MGLLTWDLDRLSVAACTSGVREAEWFGRCGSSSV